MSESYLFIIHMRLKSVNNINKYKNNKKEYGKHTLLSCCIVWIEFYWIIVKWYNLNTTI